METLFWEDQGHFSYSHFFYSTREVGDLDIAIVHVIEGVSVVTVWLWRNADSLQSPLEEFCQDIIHGQENKQQHLNWCPEIANMIQPHTLLCLFLCLWSHENVTKLGFISKFFLLLYAFFGNMQLQHMIFVQNYGCPNLICRNNTQGRVVCCRVLKVFGSISLKSCSETSLESKP